MMTVLTLYVYLKSEYDVLNHSLDYNLTSDTHHAEVVHDL